MLLKKTFKQKVKLILEFHFVYYAYLICCNKLRSIIIKHCDSISNNADWKFTVITNQNISGKAEPTKPTEASENVAAQTEAEAKKAKKAEEGGGKKKPQWFEEDQVTNCLRKLNQFKNT